MREEKKKEKREGKKGKREERKRKKRKRKDREIHKVLQGNFLISSLEINFEEILDELSLLC
jgi:hypothetical protein